MKRIRGHEEVRGGREEVRGGHEEVRGDHEERRSVVEFWLRVF